VFKGARPGVRLGSVAVFRLNLVWVAVEGGGLCRAVIFGCVGGGFGFRVESLARLGMLVWRVFLMVCGA